MRILRLVMTAMFLLLAGCAKTEFVEAPRISCPSLITVEQGDSFKLTDYCTVEGSVLYTDVDTSRLGTWPVTITASNNGSVSLYQTKVNVVDHIPEVEEPEPMDDPPVVSEEPSGDEVAAVQPCAEGTHRENGACVPNKVKEEPDEQEEQEPSPTTEPAPQETPVSTPTPTATPRPQTGWNTTPAYTPSPSYSHGSKEYWEGDYGDIFEAQNACIAELNGLIASGIANGGSCVPSEDESHIVLTY